MVMGEPRKTNVEALIGVAQVEINVTSELELDPGPDVQKVAFLCIEGVDLLTHDAGKPELRGAARLHLIIEE